VKPAGDTRLGGGGCDQRMMAYIAKLEGEEG
jgi:hypothetical protein